VKAEAFEQDYAYSLHRAGRALEHPRRDDSPCGKHAACFPAPPRPIPCFVRCAKKGQGQWEIAAAFSATSQIVETSVETRPVRPAPARGLCEDAYAGKTADGLHCEPKNTTRQGPGLGCDQFFLKQGALPDPAHAHRDLGPGASDVRAVFVWCERL